MRPLRPPVKAVAFDEPYRTDDGVVVQITEIDESTLGPFPNYRTTLTQRKGTRLSY